MPEFDELLSDAGVPGDRLELNAKMAAALSSPVHCVLYTICSFLLPCAP